MRVPRAPFYVKTVLPVDQGRLLPKRRQWNWRVIVHVEAISVGVGTTYSLTLNQKDVESCPQKEAIFKVIRTWEDARAVNAFPRWVKKELADASQSFHLEAMDANNWNLYKTNRDGSGRKLFVTLKRADGY